MFEKSGKVIKVMAHIVFWGELVYAFAIVYTWRNALIAFLALIVGPISAYLTASLIYGIGESADFAQKNNTRLEKLDFVDSKSSSALYNQDKLAKTMKTTLDELGGMNLKLETLTERIERLIKNKTCCEDSSETIWYVAKNNKAIKTTESELTAMIIEGSVTSETLVVNADIKDWMQVCNTDLWKKIKNNEEEVDEK